jgi:hypothetical protein
MNEPVKTGIDVLREMCRIRIKKIAYSGMARDIGLDPESIVAFAEGRKILADEKLQALTKYLLNGSAEYDPETKMLRSANKTPPIPAGIPPAPWKTPADYVVAKYQPLPAEAKATSKPKRPGWLGNWPFGA